MPPPKPHATSGGASGASWRLWRLQWWRSRCRVHGHWCAAHGAGLPAVAPGGSLNPDAAPRGRVAVVVAKLAKILEREDNEQMSVHSTLVGRHGRWSKGCAGSAPFRRCTTHTSHTVTDRSDRKFLQFPAFQVPPRRRCDLRGTEAHRTKYEIPEAIACALLRIADALLLCWLSSTSSEM